MSSASLLAAQFSAFKHNVSDERFESWCEISKLIGVNNLFIDRTHQIESPFKAEVAEICFLPKIERGFSKTYEDLCDDRIQDLLRLQASLQKPLCILYSGGIDSTAVMASLLKHASPSSLKGRVHIYLNPSSINENPQFYKNYIRGQFHLESSEKCMDLFDGNNIVVTAEFNDQLFGNYHSQALFVQHGEKAAELKYSVDLLSRMLANFNFTKKGADYWTEILDVQVKAQTYARVERMIDFMWWFNFIYKWQATYFNLVLRMPPRFYNKVSSDFLQSHLQHFFLGADFQKWSMLNPEKKIKKSWSSYKWAAKELIYNFNKDEYYRDNKIKAPSLNYIINQRTIAKALTSDYRFFRELDSTAQNAFRRW